MICSYTKEGFFNPRYARLRLQTTEDGLWCDPVVCIQCDNPACMRVCPTHALYRDEKTQAVILDQDKCTNCGLCIKHCHLGMIALNPGAKRPVKCDLCGGEPQCTAHCPTGALTLVQIAPAPAGHAYDPVRPATRS